MRKIIFIILLLAFCVSNIWGQSEITQEEYDFYSKFLVEKSVIVRYTELPPYDDFQYVRKKLKGIPKELVNDFFQKNDKSYRIENKLIGFRFSDEPKPNLNTEKEIVFVWDILETVSRVGFTKDGKQALIRYERYCEAVPCGVEDFIWMINEKGNWKIKKRASPVIF